MRVSVCIPVYNMELSIEKSIRSALNQTYSDYEIIVVDNQSTDRTFEIASSIGNERLKVYRNEKNIGMYENHNRCMEIAEGEWIKFLHGDDELVPTCLEEMVSATARCPQDTALLACGAVYCDPSGNWTNTFVPDDLFVMRAAPPAEFVLEGNIFGTPTMAMIHRKRLIDAGGFDLSSGMAADGDCWVKLRTLHPSAYLPQHLVIVIMDPPQKNEKRINTILRNCRETFRQMEKWRCLNDQTHDCSVADSYFTEWVCRESFRFWDVSFSSLLHGKKEVLDTLYGELRRNGLLGRSFKFYLFNRFAGRNSSNFRTAPWTESLKHLHIPASTCMRKE